MIALAFAAATLLGLDAAIKASVAPCPPREKGEITVCASREPERSRFASPIPYEYAVGDPRAQSVSAKRNGLFDYDGGGTGSCSASGAGGAYGCEFKAFKRWVVQRAGARDPRGPIYDK